MRNNIISFVDPHCAYILYIISFEIQSCILFACSHSFVSIFSIIFIKFALLAIVDVVPGIMMFLLLKILFALFAFLLTSYRKTNSFAKVMQQPAIHCEQTADSDTASTYLVSSVLLISDRKLEALDTASQSTDRPSTTVHSFHKCDDVSQCFSNFFALEPFTLLVISPNLYYKYYLLQ